MLPATGLLHLGPSSTPGLHTRPFCCHSPVIPPAASPARVIAQGSQCLPLVAYSRASGSPGQHEIVLEPPTAQPSTLPPRRRRADQQDKATLAGPGTQQNQQPRDTSYSGSNRQQSSTQSANAAGSRRQQGVPPNGSTSSSGRQRHVPPPPNDVGSQQQQQQGGGSRRRQEVRSSDVSSNSSWTSQPHQPATAPPAFHSTGPAEAAPLDPLAARLQQLVEGLQHSGNTLPPRRLINCSLHLTRLLEQVAAAGATAAPAAPAAAGGSAPDATAGAAQGGLSDGPPSPAPRQQQRQRAVAAVALLCRALSRDCTRMGPAELLVVLRLLRLVRRQGWLPLRQAHAIISTTTAGSSSSGTGGTSREASVEAWAGQGGETAQTHSPETDGEEGEEEEGGWQGPGSGVSGGWRGELAGACAALLPLVSAQVAGVLRGGRPVSGRQVAQLLEGLGDMDVQLDGEQRHAVQERLQQQLQEVCAEGPPGADRPPPPVVGAQQQQQQQQGTAWEDAARCVAAAARVCGCESLQQDTLQALAAAMQRTMQQQEQQEWAEEGVGSAMNQLRLTPGTCAQLVWLTAQRRMDTARSAHANDSSSSSSSSDAGAATGIITARRNSRPEGAQRTNTTAPGMPGEYISGSDVSQGAVQGDPYLSAAALSWQHAYHTLSGGGPAPRPHPPAGALPHPVDDPLPPQWTTLLLHQVEQAFGPGGTPPSTHASPAPLTALGTLAGHWRTAGLPCHHAWRARLLGWSAASLWGEGGAVQAERSQGRVQEGEDEKERALQGAEWTEDRGAERSSGAGATGGNQGRGRGVVQGRVGHNGGQQQRQEQQQQQPTGPPRLPPLLPLLQLAQLPGLTTPTLHTPSLSSLTDTPPPAHLLSPGGPHDQCSTAAEDLLLDTWVNTYCQQVLCRVTAMSDVQLHWLVNQLAAAQPPPPALPAQPPHAQHQQQQQQWRQTMIGGPAATRVSSSTGRAGGATAAMAGPGATHSPPPAGLPATTAAAAAAAASVAAGEQRLVRLATSSLPWSLEDCATVAQALSVAAAAAGHDGDQQQHQEGLSGGGGGGHTTSAGDGDWEEEEEETQGVGVTARQHGWAGRGLGGRGGQDGAGTGGSRAAVLDGGREGSSQVGGPAALPLHPGVQPLVLQLLLRHTAGAALWLAETGHEQAPLLGPAYHRLRLTAAAGWQLRPPASHYSPTSTTSSPPPARWTGGSNGTGAPQGSGSGEGGGEGHVSPGIPQPTPSDAARLVDIMSSLSVVVQGRGLSQVIEEGDSGLPFNQRRDAPLAGVLAVALVRSAQRGLPADFMPTPLLLRALHLTRPLRIAPRSARWRGLLQLNLARRVAAGDLRAAAAAAAAAGSAAAAAAAAVPAAAPPPQTDRVSSATLTGHGGTNGAAFAAAPGAHQSLPARVLVQSLPVRVLEPVLELLQALAALRMGTGANLDSVLSRELLTWHLAATAAAAAAVGTQQQQQGTHDEDDGSALLPATSWGPGGTHDADDGNVPRAATRLSRPGVEQAAWRPPAGWVMQAEEEVPAAPWHALHVPAGVLLDKDVVQLLRVMRQAAMPGSAALVERLHALVGALAGAGRMRGKLVAGAVTGLCRLGRMPDPQVLAALAACALELQLGGGVNDSYSYSQPAGNRADSSSSSQGGPRSIPPSRVASSTTTSTQGVAAWRVTGGDSSGNVGSSGGAQTPSRPLDLSHSRALLVSLRDVRYPPGSEQQHVLRELAAELDGAGWLARKGQHAQQQAAQRLRAVLQRLAAAGGGSAAGNLLPHPSGALGASPQGPGSSSSADSVQQQGGHPAARGRAVRGGHDGPPAAKQPPATSAASAAAAAGGSPSAEALDVLIATRLAQLKRKQQRQEL